MYKEYLINLKSENISKYHHQEELTYVINKKTIRNHLNKLIREYNIVPETLTPWSVVKHVMNTLFWATVYLAFSYLTIISTFDLIQQYRDNPVATNMKAMVNKNVTYLPNMTICLKINKLELFNISSSSSFDYMQAWSGFFNENISPEGIFEVNEGQIYDDEIYLSLLKYLAMIYEAERAWESGLTQISTFHSEKGDDWIALKKVLVPNIERFNITLEQLKSIFDGKFCSLPAMGAQNRLLDLDHGDKSETECVTGSKISFIGIETICFRLIGYKSYLRQLGTTEFIYLNLYEKGYIQKWFQEFTIDVGSESRSTPRRATTRNETHTYYHNRFLSAAAVYMHIGVKALYRKLPYVKGDVQCSSDTTREECENKCLRGWIRANCHCSPTTFNLTVDTSSYRNCTVDEYSVCLNKYAENTSHLCTNKCVPLCEQWHYEYSSEVQSYYTAFAQLRLKTFDYVIIEQVFTWNSFEEFIGALGGALGIWLGLDFLIISEFLVELVSKLIKKILLRNVHNSEDDEHRKSPNIKHGELNVENGISSSNGMENYVDGHQKKNKENETEINGTSIRQINESEKQRTSRKKGESNALKGKHVQKRRKLSHKSGVDRAILDDKKKNINGHDGRLRNQRVNITDNVDTVQDESTTHANNISARNWFLLKMLALFLNGDASTNKRAVFLGIVKKLFWAVIYLVGSVFTTLWCVELIKLYLADEAIYIPSLIINRTVSLPPPSLCITYSDNLYYESDNNISKALMDYFGQSKIDRASFIRIADGEDWPELLVSIGLVYINILGASETNYQDITFISEYENQLNSSADRIIPLKNDIENSLIYILLPKLLEWNITANELRQKLGAELARMADLKISFTNSNGTLDIVNKTSFYTSAITDNLVCYGLTYGINFNDQDDVLEVSVNRTLYPNLLSGSGGYIFFSDYLLEPKRANFDITGANLAVFDLTYFEFIYGNVERTLISAEGLHTSRSEVKGEQYCSQNTTLSYCRAQCRIKLIQKLCNCSPIYWAKLIPPTSGLDECTFNRYMECLNFNAKEDRDCKDSCLPFCTARYFRSDVTWQSLSDNFMTAVIRFSVKEGVYTSIEEKRIFTFNDLLIKVQLDT